MWLSWLRICLQCGRPRFDSCVGKIPWRREWPPTPVFWPGEFHRLYNSWGHKESDTTESRSLAILYLKGFPHSSVGKESTCNAGDAGSIPGLGKPPEEGIGYPLQYSWASLVTQLVKNPPAMQETPVHLLSQEDPLEKG